MAERKVGWAPREENALIGKEIQRIDGIEKASGHAKYTADINTKGTLYAKLLTFKGGHARLKRLNLDPAKKVKGVQAVLDLRKVGDELHWDGDLVAVVAADRPELADDGIRAIEVEYEPLPHFVEEANLDAARDVAKQQQDQLIATFPEEIRQLLAKNEKQRSDAENEKLAPYLMKLKEADRTKPLGEQKKGNVDEALQNAKVVHKGFYGIDTISHMCLEPHGAHAEWKDSKLDVHLSTQNVSGTAGQIAGPLGVAESDVQIICNYVGGGFGSKFAADEWGVAAARLAKETGRPVKLMLDRATELKTPGTRPSGYVEVTVGADENGKIIAWQSHHWGTSGPKGSTVSLGVMPYVIDPPNRLRSATGLICNTGENRAWRAPNHPQACALSQTAYDDLAAKLGMDSLEFFKKNLDLTNLPDLYAAELDIAAKLIDWKAKWHPRGKGDNGPVKRGVGLALHTWGGGAHTSNCNLRVNPDGTVEVTLGSQDIGTGTRTCIAIVAAETFGIPLDSVKVNLGTNKYPKSGPSGGSTTVGGVTGPTRRAAQEALWKIFDKVAEKYKKDADSLTAKDGNILSKGEKVCSWKDAAKLVGAMAIEVQGSGPKKDGLTDQQVGGVQMADVSVDTETGKVRINKMVAVQDCGLIIDLMTAKSQVYGALIMGIAFALTEQRIMDPKTGRYINADLENYKLPRIGDIGELVVEMYQPDDQYKRGVIGLGEPPVIAPGAAISNAVANAVGVRVPVLPMTPQRVLDALKGGRA